MKSGQLPAQEPDGLFKTPLSQFIIDMKYPLVRLADKIDWSHLEGVVEERFTDCGCPGVPVRFMIGMLILKATDNLSDEMLFERWPCNPYDGDTLGDILKETEELTGVTPQRVYVDKRYKGQKQNQSWFDPETHQDVRNPWKVYMSGRKGLKSHQQRSAVEPIIGHLKDDHRMDSNYLKGKNGDRFNVKMAAIGFNFRRILAWMKDVLCQILAFLLRGIQDGIYKLMKAAWTTFERKISEVPESLHLLNRRLRNQIGTEQPLSRFNKTRNGLV